MTDNLYLSGLSAGWGYWYLKNLSVEDVPLGPTEADTYATDLKQWYLSETPFLSGMVSQAQFFAQASLPPGFTPMVTFDSSGYLSVNEVSGSMYIYNWTDLVFPSATQNWNISITDFCAAQTTGTPGALWFGGPLDASITATAGQSVVFLAEGMKMNFNVVWE